ncbi:hypothetical protein [Pseudoalteromonas luteoviolacea]|uniref:Uncharacterized protein n=1 Tax=Pseudoalteromonas luteoviolacea S4054 TaxID=1129367 RepID=A0A0F6AHA7_9GAMM|nr:hypothetical protein [Pseudoalteromonas luteoviolacea]AOT08715.1 hypothetical protein S4054249_13010 [Pseudoalteromonas luteoviolacea]AOT13630.1 hypothetical protein S40542_12985 [Pseudoalteromonas luteoviolacea]AOT18543.1 hypothetical protein S4054_12985 [Pseudoalteromonas luteoviolacea]KKE85610.1 hypothetical protein N479_25685 [Pseudoalteromonas luteoviolacea S4054]KZN71980.1 hypothetical protein N481_16345 [Pseudoalteromonas luteoviolacea S4047-1]
MSKLFYLVLILFSFGSVALPHGGYWKPEFKSSACVMWQTSSIEVSPELNLSIAANFSLKGKRYVLSELQKSYGFQKGHHILGFIIHGAYNHSFGQVDYPLELYVNGGKLNKVQIEGVQYFYLMSNRVFDILAGAEKGISFDVELKSASGESFTVEYNYEQLSLSTKMYLTCSENII